jgi:dTDP-4-dehydrorhamnose 3,5-epimerase
MTSFIVSDEPFPGVFVLDCSVFNDHRGDFTKFFHYPTLARHGIDFNPCESFLTRSKKMVLRGMHYQTGDAAHAKLVTCIKGSVLDVVVDIRPDSPTFRKTFSIELSECNSKALLIDKGYAHGFLSLDDDNWMMYFTSTVHSPLHDRGVLWSSIPFDWGCSEPIVSDRDANHPPIASLL